MPVLGDIEVKKAESVWDFSFYEQNSLQGTMNSQKHGIPLINMLHKQYFLGPSVWIENWIGEERLGVQSPLCRDTLVYLSKSLLSKRWHTTIDDMRGMN